MTRRQVRATMRRMREHADEAEEEPGELNLVPYLDIITNVIIFLLASVAYNVSYANVNVTQPKIAGVAGAVDVPETDPLNLTVNAGASGFLIGASGGILGETVPKLPSGDYDYQALTRTLEKIKTEFPNETKAIFNADSYIPYDVVVKSLDAMRENGKGKQLFPDIVFSAGIL